MDVLSTLDKQLFIFINQTLANPVFDVMMPPFTDWNKSWIGWGIFGLLWLLLMWKGGKKGRIVGIILIPLIVSSDQINSALVKSLFHRPRPCHVIDGKTMVESVRLLVPCGSGYSFPSSHAVNNFAFAAFLSFYYRRWAWIFYTYAFLIGLSRIVVGVHYPFDVAGGAIIGIVYAFIVIGIYEFIGKIFPVLRVQELSASPIVEPQRQNELY